MTSTPRRNVRRFTLVFILAFTSAFVALSTLERNDSIVPLAPYRVFVSSQDKRGLSTSTTPTEEALRPFNHEVPFQKSATFLIGIFSSNSGKYSNRRSYIRDTYLSSEDPRICKLSEYMRQVEESPSYVQCIVPYTFVVGAGGKDRPTDHDDDEPLTLETDQDGNMDPNGDITYLNIRENMENGKSPTWFKYAANVAKASGIDYIGKLDDDSVLSPELLFNFIAHELPPQPANARIYGGPIWATYAKSVVYAAGQFYFMSSDLADYVANQLTATDRLEMQLNRHTEDADMGTFVFSHPRPVKFLNLSNYRIWIHPMKKEKPFRDTWDNIYDLPHAARRGLPIDYLCQEWLKGGGV